jgi:hypothetical protein
MSRPTHQAWTPLRQRTEPLPVVMAPPLEPHVLAQAPTFAVIDKNVLIHRADPRDGLDKHRYAPVAWCPRRKAHIARWSSRFGWSVATWDNTKLEITDPKFVPTDWRAKLDDVININGGALVLDVGDPATVEFERMRNEYPHLVGQLVQPVAPVRLFDPGSVLMPRKMYHDWLPLVKRHLSGDFGLEGQYEEPVIDEELLWCAPLEPTSVKNSLAIKLRTGEPIISCYAALPEPVELNKPVRYPWIVTANGRTVCYFGPR